MKTDTIEAAKLAKLRDEMKRIREYAQRLGLVLVKISSMRFTVLKLVPIGSGSAGYFASEPVNGGDKLERMTYQEAHELLKSKIREFESEEAGRVAAECIFADPNFGKPPPDPTIVPHVPAAKPEQDPTFANELGENGAG